ncbi:hypothetical protein HZS_135, partial [Henneguya salminicola]
MHLNFLLLIQNNNILILNILYLGIIDGFEALDELEQLPTDPK